LTDRVFYRFAWAEARHTARRQGLDRGDCGALPGIGRIVADPRVEQVPEDIQGVGGARLGLQKLGELPDDWPARRVDV